ncbi:hypothetical protein D3C77_541000 [compost metagenome]
MPVNPNELNMLPKEMSDKEFLKEVADGLDRAEREDRGGQGEGSKVIWLSHELAVIIAERLKSIAERIEDDHETTP